ncbi:hypothetical protein Gpo141_00004327 [Globisporangium polare]
MKFASVLAIAATVALASSSVGRASAAAPCTQSDAETILSLTGEILSDKNCMAATNAECPNASCYTLLEKVTDQMPSCVADGKNPKEIYQKLLKDCKGSKSAASHRSGATSAALALASTVLAVVMVYL